MKHAAYDALVAARKVYYVCESRGLTNPATMPDFDSDRIGPYSRWQGKLDAELMVVAQDFADVDTFHKYPRRRLPGAARRRSRDSLRPLPEAPVKIAVRTDRKSECVLIVSIIAHLPQR
jgi:hypothetical protein